MAKKMKPYWQHQTSWMRGNTTNPFVPWFVFDWNFWFSVKETLKLSEKLRTANSLFHQLVELSQIVNSIFSPTILCLLTASLLMGTVELLFLIFNVSIEPILGVDMTYIHFLSLSLNIGAVLVILTATDLPVAEVCISFLLNVIWMIEFDLMSFNR